MTTTHTHIIPNSGGGHGSKECTIDHDAPVQVKWDGSLTQAISIGIMRGLTDMGGELLGCTPSMLAMYALKQIRDTPGLVE